MEMWLELFDACVADDDATLVMWLKSAGRLDDGRN